MNFFFRVDSSLKIGTGHLIRCLTLAKVLRMQGAECKFICGPQKDNFIKLVKNEGFKVFTFAKSKNKIVKNKNDKTKKNYYFDWIETSWQEDVKNTIKALGSDIIDWLVVDHYALDKKWENKIRPYVKKIMVIDDLANRDHSCDLLLDQNLIANQETRYLKRILPNCTTFLGPKFALLQPEYSKLHIRKQINRDKIKRVLVFFGGVDKKNLTKLTLKSLLKIKRKDITFDVVISSLNPNKSNIQKFLHKKPNVNMYDSLPSLAPLMIKADIAIGACGSTTWERLCLGLPSLVITIAENQKPIAKELDRLNLIKLIGHHTYVKEENILNSFKSALDENLKKWTRYSKTITNGKGVFKIASILMINDKSKLKIRMAKKEDEQLLLLWANDPIVRANAFSPDIISSQVHSSWFHSRLNNGEFCKIFILETIEGVPIGQVRFEKKFKKWFVNYSLSKIARGKNIGSRLLNLSIQKFKKKEKLTLFAEVKKSNNPSIKIFKKNKFKLTKSFNKEFFTFFQKV
tara:strand:+ start:5280 stop:6830 length:1551 start_codon:yes stop_codon:yes gene_type:complete